MHKIRYIFILTIISLLAIAPGQVLAGKDFCPIDLPTGGPTSGSDLTDQVPTYFPQDTGSGDTSYTGDISTTTYESADLGHTANPAGNSYSASFNSCHGMTPCHQSDDSGHGAYKNRGGSNGDALDITPSSGKAYAAFDGIAQVIYGSSESSSGAPRDGGVKIVSKNGRVAAYYYHTIPRIRSGQEVAAGTVIANTGADGIGHIHFELLVDGKSVHGNTTSIGSPENYQRSLWANMQKVLGI